MDPVSIVMLTNASLGIARSLAHTIKELYELAEAYETAALGIRTVATQCNSFRVAIQRIHSWLTTQDEASRFNLDDDFWQALSDNLETGRLVLDDLEKRISGLKKDSAKFWVRTKYLWNSVVISELQSQIQGLMSAVSLLVQVIDMPTAGGRRSQSLAQRSRLNNITKTVRLTVDQRRERIQQSQEQSLLDEVDNDSTSGALQEPLPTSAPSLPRNNSTNDPFQQQASELFSTDNPPPPPYDFYDKDRKETKSRSMPMMFSTKKPPEVVLPENEDPSDPKDAKSKRSIWTMGFKKRSSTPKVDQVPRSLSDPRGNSTQDIAEPPTISQILNPFDDSNSQMQHTPAAVEPSKEEKEYFALQDAMSGVSMSTSTNPFSSTSNLDRKNSREPKQDEASMSGGPAELYSNNPYFTNPPIEKDANPPSANPYTTTSPPPFNNSLTNPSGYDLLSSHSDRSRSISDTNQTESTTSTQSYYPPRPDQTTTNPPTSPPTNPYASLASSKPAFDRIRPSQRVRESRDRSRSRDPPRQSQSQTQTTTPPNSLSRQLSPTPLPPSATTQTWRTTPLPSTSASSTTTTSPPLSSSLSTSSTTRLKISFSPTLYTSRISHPAATALHLLEHATTTPTGDPLALLTLLYPVSDGSSQTVLADEVELEVMHEGESRGLEIVFGAGQGHVAGVMEGSDGGCLWWSERGVPRGLRTVEGLRLFRRFELVRW